MFWASLFSKIFEPCLFSNGRLLSREYGILVLYGFLLYCMVFYGIVWFFLAVIGPNAFGLVYFILITGKVFFSPGTGI